MLNILGLGFAIPENIIDNKFLSDLGIAEDPAVLNKLGIVGRRTTLNLDYLKRTKNQKIAESIFNATESPTDLVLRATNIALAQAGISHQQIGLVLGDGSTPVETTPSEAQRLGARLELEIPAFDLCPGYAGPSGAAYEALEHFRTERIPDYVLIVSTHTPTQKVDYSQGVEGAIFGDGAVAMVVSAKFSGSVKLTKCSFEHRENAPQISISALNHATINQPLDFDNIGRLAAQIVNQAVADGVALERCALVGPQISAASLNYLYEQFNVSANNRWSDASSNGYALGAAELGVVARRWQELVSGNRSVLTIGAVGPITGYALYES